MSIENPQETMDSLKQEERNWTEHPLGAATAAGAIVLEAAPVPLNEGLRAASITAAYGLAGPEAAIAAAGISTMLIEGGAAIAAADLLASSRGLAATQKVGDFLERVKLNDKVKTNVATDTLLAVAFGSAVATAVKHQQDPERTRVENRTFGIRNAATLSLLTMAETVAVAQGIEHPSPATIGVGALAVAAALGLGNSVRKRLSGEIIQEPEHKVHKRNNIGDSPQRLGLSEEDSISVMEDERTVFIEVDGKKTPVLAPVDRLYWYNREYLKDHFKTDQIYYYAHPVVEEESDLKEMYDGIKDVISQGGVVLYDTVSKDDTLYGDLDHELTEYGVDHKRVGITKDDRQRFLYQYDGGFLVSGKNSKEFSIAPSIYDTYVSAVKEGKIQLNTISGPALADSIEGEEAERLWQIYQKPFQKLSNEHPINVAYSKEDFIEMLRDPSTVKAVYREDGQVTTLAFFLNDIKQANWLEPRYYEQRFPEAVATNNHFIFPGIVTDELKKGAAYSVPLIQLIAKVQSLRKTPAVISFECTDISYKYVPRIVRFAIRKSGVAKTAGLAKPNSRFDYYAITA